VRSWSLAFLCGILCLIQFSSIPSLHWIDVIFIVVILIYVTNSKYQKYLKLCAAFLAGFAWVLWVSHSQIAARLPSELEGKEIPLTGYIASIPNNGQHGINFLFALQKRNNLSVHGLVKLTWNNKDLKLHVGDQWQLHVRLKKPYGTLNPGGFDYEAFAFQAGITGNGYVVTKLDNTLLSSHWYHYSIDRIRQYLKEKIALNLPQSATSQWIPALAIGERNDIDAADWQVLRNTGTNHLMAIAGLHIGFMAFLAHFIIESLWRRVPRLALRVPAQHAGAVAALLMALTYSAMAGFSIPTQRACLMLFIFLFALLLRRQLVAWQAWSGALLCVLLFNPLSVLTESFWLSFGSVALIIYGVSGRLSPTGLWWKWGRIQWVIAAGLVPLSIGLFQQCSLISFVANSIAIPWVGFIVVPLCFLGTFLLLFSAKLGGLILCLADKILSVLWIVLDWFAHLPGVVWYQFVPAHWMIIAGIFGMIFLLLPAGFPGRYFSVIWLLPLILYKAPAPKAGEVWLTLLDVGQGLSAVIQTEKHVLVFDAGPRFSSSFDMGESVVLPFLHSLGTKRLDMLVISHGDNDHIGGAKAITSQMPVLSIKTSVPQLLPGSDFCFSGLAWNWDDVNFAFLYPGTNNLDLNNDSSCVLRITSGKQHILLAGDIEKFAENELVENQWASLSANILVAPHHGSKTSAQKRFIRGVAPQYVLYPIGYRNRYHFPHPVVIKTYREFGVEQYDTAKSGAIKFVLSTTGKIAPPNFYRQDHKHYWNNS
jgi:competence protein ComEC